MSLNCFYNEMASLLEALISIAAKRSCLNRTNSFPFFHGFCRSSGLKSSRRHRSLVPTKHTRQKSSS